MRMEENGKILIVDDDQALMNALCDTLRDHGYFVVGYVSAEEALKGLSRGKFDLVLSDLNMPEMDGITMLQRAIEIDRNLVGIIMTGQGTVNSAVEAMKIGALDFILKPFKMNAILPVLNRAMDIRKLRVENKKLNKQLKERTLELETSNKDLESFSYSVSHDLRSPLMFIFNLINMIRDEHDQTISAQVMKMITQIQHNAENMDRLIVELLRFTKSGTSELIKSVLDTHSLVQTIIEEIRVSEGPTCKFEVSDLPEIVADEPLMRQVFINLISNAVKYSGKKADATVWIGGQNSDDEITFYVKDNGDGFDTSKSEKLFEAFQRLHSQKEFPGSGIGLSIVKRIVVRHGGQIWATGEKGKGAEFFFTLPRA